MKKLLAFKKKIEKNKPLRIIYNILKTIITIILIVMLVIILAQRLSKNNIAIGGVRAFTIVSESMVPKYQIGDILISKKVPISEINKGDDVTYQGTTGDMAGLVVTHQVINKGEENGKTFFITKGLANSLADPQIDESQVYGKVIYKTVLLSFLGRLMSNIVAYYIIFIIVGLMVSYQIVKIVYDSKEEDDLSGEEK